MISKISKRSSKGLVRKRNEDNITNFSFKGAGSVWECFAVADGVGGHNAGDLASSIFVEKIQELLVSNINNFETKDLIKAVIKDINSIIYEKSLEEENYEGMGTTITMALINEDNLHIGHVGDSRAYLFRDNHLEMLTQDHSIVGELVQSGLISKEEAMNHPRRNIILQAVGLEENLRIDYIYEKLMNNDLILLCTDGFSDLVSDVEIKLELNENEERAIDVLTKLVVERGAHDNYSVIVAKWIDKEEVSAID